LVRSDWAWEREVLSALSSESISATSLGLMVPPGVVEGDVDGAELAVVEIVVVVVAPGPMTWGEPLLHAPHSAPTPRRRTPPAFLALLDFIATRLPPLAQLRAPPHSSVGYLDMGTMIGVLGDF
jgi:hypothetical protein